MRIRKWRPSIQFLDRFGLSRKDFAWKVRWRMRNDRNPLLTRVHDKYLVKEYAADRGVKTAGLLHVTDRPETLPFDTLPPDCFIKFNRGSTRNILRKNGELLIFGGGGLPVAPGATIDATGPAGLISEEECVGICRGWLKSPPDKDKIAHLNLAPMIVVEELLESADGGELKDYRFYVFDGEARAINVGCASYRRHHQNAFFDLDWQEIPLTRHREARPTPAPMRPEALEEMIRTARVLAEGLDFVRVDLYETPSGVVLGELTIYPEAGGPGTPTWCPRFNKWLGEQWHLPQARDGAHA